MTAADQRDVRRVHRRDGDDRRTCSTARRTRTRSGLLHSIPRVDDDEGEPLIPIEGRPPDMRRRPDRLPVRAALRVAARRVLDRQPRRSRRSIAGTAVVTTGPGATHRVACHNPPTADEAAPAGRCATGSRPRRRPRAARRARAHRRDRRLGGLEAEITAEEGPISVDRQRRRPADPARAGASTATASHDARDDDEPAASGARRRRHAAARGRGPQGLLPDHARACIVQRHVGDVRAVDGVSFDACAAARRSGLVGESGCGKSHDRAGRSSGCYKPTGGRDRCSTAST